MAADVIKAKSGRGFRPPTKRRLKDGRQNEMILMFVMVRQTHLRKRLDWQRIAAEIQGEWQGVLATEVAKQIGAA